MQFHEIINPISLAWSFFLSLGTLVIYRRWVFNSQENALKVSREENAVYREKMDRIDEDHSKLLDKDRINERRMLELEDKSNRSLLQHECDRSEIDLMQDIVTLCMAIILPLANGSKSRIEAKIAELAEHRQNSRQKMRDHDDKERLFRTYPKP